ncbi:MAG: hypothetical protein JM58_12230 [Peptococcaceae bacterium BICA1-8]|nr:MAG: hypothetical protein JM58_12230 [Peptococcaceae bacterium BICA1-8]
MASFVSNLEQTRPLIDWDLMLNLKQERANVILEEEDIDAVLVNGVENVIYLTNWPRYRTSVHPGAYSALFIKGAKEPVIFVSEGDSRGILEDKTYSDIRILPPYNKSWPQYFKKALEDYDLLNGNIGLDAKMATGLYINIMSHMPEVNFINANSLLDKIRMIKNSEEIKAYEYTVSLLEGAINKAIFAAKNSWGQYTEIEIANIATMEALRKGCTNVDIWCVSGHRTAPVRRYSTDKPVRGCETAVIDGPASFNGFRNEFARTVWTGGKPSDDHKKIYTTVYNALEKAKSIIRPGTKTSELEKVILEVVHEAGYEKDYGGYPYTGHGIGIRQEPPYITARFPELDTVLEEGMIFNLEPAIWNKDVCGVRIEDTYLVTNDGYRVLTKAPYDEDLLDLQI